MSHHFDSKLGRENPALSICDAYLFEGAPGRTVMAMTVNADVGLSSPDVLPDEGLYAFRFDLDGDARDDLVFKFRFGKPAHADTAEHTHVQSFEARMAKGDDIPGEGGGILISGVTGQVNTAGDISAFVGVAPELWAADAIAFFNMLEALYKEDRFGAEAFEHRTNFFQNRNLMALVLEVPTAMIGTGKVGFWTTTSLYGHAPETQVYRWGLPLLTHLFLSDPASSVELVERYHESTPSEDTALFAAAIAGFATKLSARANPAGDPVTHGREVVARLCPAVLPYELGTMAEFSVERFNGRPLATDGYDVMLTLAANRPIADGVAPPVDRIKAQFPYYGAPYSRAEQASLTPISTGFEA
jgi:hypothetical protein